MNLTDRPTPLTNAVERIYSRSPGYRVQPILDHARHIERQRDALAEIVKELVTEAPTIEYTGDNDDIGSCIHCHSLSFRDHDDSCLITRGKRLLEQLANENK